MHDELIHFMSVKVFCRASIEYYVNNSILSPSSAIVSVRKLYKIYVVFIECIIKTWKSIYNLKKKGVFDYRDHHQSFG